MTLPIFHRDNAVTLEGKFIGTWEKSGRFTHNFRHVDGTELNGYYPILVLKRAIRKRWGQPEPEDLGFDIS